MHDVVNPQPYDRINLIQGVKGIFRDYPPRIYFDDPNKEAFESVDKYKAEYGHRLWKLQGEQAQKLGGHGGMDFLMVYRLVECMKQGHRAGHGRLRRGSLVCTWSAEAKCPSNKAAHRSSSPTSRAAGGRKGAQVSRRVPCRRFSSSGIDHACGRDESRFRRGLPLPPPALTLLISAGRLFLPARFTPFRFRRRPIADKHG